MRAAAIVTAPIMAAPTVIARPPRPVIMAYLDRRYGGDRILEHRRGRHRRTRRGRHHSGQAGGQDQPSGKGLNPDGSRQTDLHRLLLMRRPPWNHQRRGSEIPSPGQFPTSRL
jgi:hypothetical protein